MSSWTPSVPTPRSPPLPKLLKFVTATSERLALGSLLGSAPEGPPSAQLNTGPALTARHNYPSIQTFRQSNIINLGGWFSHILAIHILNIAVLQCLLHCHYVCVPALWLCLLGSMCRLMRIPPTPQHNSPVLPLGDSRTIPSNSKHVLRSVQLTQLFHRFLVFLGGSTPASLSLVSLIPITKLVSTTAVGRNIVCFSTVFFF